MAKRAPEAHRPPTRSCVACRTSRPKQDLLRVVRSPNGAILFDATGRANGRGAYVCRDGDCIANAIGRGAMSRTLESSMPATLRAELEQAAGRNVIDPGGTVGQE